MKHRPGNANAPCGRKPKPNSDLSELRHAPVPNTAAPARGQSKHKRLPVLAEPKRRARSGPNCTACGLCCTYVAIEVDGPTSCKRATELLWYVYHEGVSLYVNDDDWMVQFETTCRYLQPDYRCGIYATRPHICREFSEKECEVNTGDDGHTFHTAAEFLEYLKQTRPRVHTLVQKGFAPPQASARRGLTAFERRFRAVHARRAKLRA